MFAGAFLRRTVLVTGHTGFKGSWLAVWLRRLGATVVGYSLAPRTDPNLFDACGLSGATEDIRGDVRETSALAAVLERHRPDFIFHLAAQALVRESYAEPRETFDVNVMGTVSLLEAIRRASHACTVVAVTTDKCYENREWVYGYRETDPLGGHDPYSASKAAMEIAVASYRSSFFPPERVSAHGVRLASVRAGNVIGGGDWSADRIIPDAIRALARGEAFEVRNPASVRPWQHVLEPLSGYLWLAARMAREGGETLAGGWNFGPAPTESYTVAQVAEAVVEAWGSGAWTRACRADAPREAGRLMLCIDKARSGLGWLPVWDFGTTIGRTVAWYYRTGGAPEARRACGACLEDIEAYELEASRRRLAWAV